MRSSHLITALVIAFACSAVVHGQTQPAARAVFCLDARQKPNDASGRHSLLVREMVRQAILIAARDELGLATRDVTLREPFPAGARVFDVEFAAAEKGQFKAALVEHGVGPNSKTLWQRTISVPVYYKDLAEALVEASDRPLYAELGTALQGAGFRGAPTGKPADAAMPAGTEKSLEEMNCFPQFAALRQLHAAIRKDGESPAVLGGLVRAYANLGQLTQLQWNAAHQAFKARAILYAQRMVAAQPDRPGPLWHRAYAWTMAGRHAAALQDLARAAELAKAVNVEAPAWVALIDASCRYETKFLLNAIGDDRNAPGAALAAYLCFLSVENSGCVDAQMRFADAAQELNPGCLRMIDAKTAAGGVSTQHRTTLEAAELFKAAIFRDLPKIPDLPQSVQVVIADAQKQANVPKSRADIAAAFVAAAHDSSEPSWAALGRIMQDTYFAQTHRRTYFIAFNWGLDQQEVWNFTQAARTLVGDHPYMLVLEAYGCWQDWPKALGLLRKVDYRDVNLSAVPFAEKLGNAHVLERAEDSLWWLMMHNRDDTTVDLERVLRAYAASTSAAAVELRAEMARALNKISPHSPLSIATLIEDDWERAQPKVPKWERAYASHPTVASALARRYTKAGRVDDAKRMWETSLAVSADVESYSALAALFLAEDNEPQWLATMETALTATDYGLSHALVRVAIAEHFMGKKDFRRALPYATAAAETWAGWAMWCASHCYEGLEDWPNAELWARRIAERYEGSAADWYVFCRRTGKGNEEAALQLARQFLGRPEPVSAGDALYRGMVHRLAGDEQAAAQLWSQGLSKFKDSDCGMLVALVADSSGDAATRDQAWASFLDRLKNHVEQTDEVAHFVSLATTFRTVSAGAAFDPTKMEAALTAEKRDVSPKESYVTARFFHNRGHGALARALYARAVASPRSDHFRTMACVELRALGVEPRTITRATTTPATRPSSNPS